MPIAPILPPTPAQINLTQPMPHPVAVPVPNAAAAGVRAQTAKAVKHANETTRARAGRSGTESDSAVDEDANALGAKSQRHPGQHTLDVEA